MGDSIIRNCRQAARQIQEMLQRLVQTVLKALPKPPYADAFFWDKTYRETYGKQGAIEWGAPPQLMLQYEYKSPDNGAVRLRVLENSTS